MFHVNYTLNEFRGLALPEPVQFDLKDIFKSWSSTIDEIALNIDLIGNIFEYDKNTFVYEDNIILPSGLIFPKNNIILNKDGPLGYTLILHINDRMRFISYLTQYQFEKVFDEVNVYDLVLYHCQNWKWAYKNEDRLLYQFFMSDDMWEDLDPKERYRVNLTFDGQIDRTIAGRH
ncbi:MAG: hypothetical protein ACK450_05170 [Sphingomonadales bacterium]|jgi:hypothetical protein